MMILTINLNIDDEIKDQLHSYGKMLRHEIYRVTGVFQKEKRTFAFPYRFMNQAITDQGKRTVNEQAVLLYKKRCINPKEKPDIAGIWFKDSCRFSEDRLLLKANGSTNQKEWNLPLTVNEYQRKLIKAGNIIDVTIKEREDTWIAVVRLSLADS